MLDKILKEIEECQRDASTDLDAVDPRVRAYATGRVNSAKEKMLGLEFDYRNEVLKRSLFVLATGNKSRDFAELATAEFACFNVGADSFYEDVVGELSTELYLDKNINASVFGVLNNILEDKMKELDIAEYNSLAFKESYQRFVKTKTEMVSIFKDAISDSVGSEVIGLYALNEASKQAMASGYSKKIVPILIHTEDESLIASLFSGIKKISPNVKVITSGEVSGDLETSISLNEVNTESVGKALKQIADNA